MSSFVVTSETINAVCSAWHTEPPAVPCEQLDKLGMELWQMNHEAYGQRYKEPAGECEPFRYRPSHYTKAQQYKAVMCLRYQCAEGDVPDTPLYLALTKLYDRLAHELANTIPAVDKAEWDLKEKAPQFIGAGL